MINNLIMEQIGDPSKMKYDRHHHADLYRYFAIHFPIRTIYILLKYNTQGPAEQALYGQVKSNDSPFPSYTI